MPRPPSVDPELVRQVFKQLMQKNNDQRPTAAEVAEVISEKLNKPVSKDLISKIVQRRGAEWGLGEAPKGGTWAAMDYACEKALGPIEPKHKTSHDWVMLTAFERHRAGLIQADQANGINAVAYVQKRTRGGLVTDYTRSGGFYTRVALPWELGCWYRQPAPEYARQEMEIHLRGKPPGEVREAWLRWLELDRAASGRLMDRRS